MKQTNPTPPAVSRWRLVLSAALTLLLWPSLVNFPGAPEGYLDASWQEVLVHAHAQGWQFGRQIIFTWGPWGFLGSHFHLGESGAVARIVWETLGKLLVAGGLVVLTQPLAAWRQALFILGLVLFNWLFADTVFYVFISLLIVGGLLAPGALRWRCGFWIAALSFLAAFKFTYLLLAGGGVLLAAGAWVWRRNYHAALVVTVGYVLAFVLVWMAAGQHPDHIVPYLRRSIELSSAYGDAMGMDETWPVFLCGAGLMVLVGAFVLRLFLTHPDRPFAVAASLFLAATWFIVWKSCFTRADGHVLGLFLFTLLLAVVLPGLCHPARRWHWFELAPLSCLLGIAITEPGLLSRCPGIALARIRANSRELPRVGPLPAAWQRSLETVRASALLPAVQAAVGRGTVDVFHYEQAVALFNDLNYSPRPIFQSYVAFSSRLAWRNLRHFQSPLAPDFVLWKHMTIDGRFPTQDDAALVSELPRGYEPALEEGDYLLLKRVRPLPAQRLDRRLLLEQSLDFNGTLTLPPAGTHPLWIQVRLPLTLIGRLRSFLYKPPQVFLITTDVTGRESTWRLLPRVAEDGFLLDPLLETQADFAAYLRSQGSLTVRSIRLTAPPGQQEYWSTIWDRPVVRLFELPEVTLQPQPRYQALVQAGLMNFTPDSIQADFPLNVFSTSAGRMMLLHAPGEMVIPLPPGAAIFSGAIGLADGSYDGDSRTDGVDFVVAAVAPDGSRRVLWQRYLDPLNRAEDRSPQSFHIALPAGSAHKLVLRTLPGPAADSRWDWSFVGNLHLDTPPAP
jgi:hypothetical protein